MRKFLVLLFFSFLIVLISGLILQVKKEFTWIQPPTAQGSIAFETPHIGFDDILEISRSDTNTTIRTWKDIDRLDVRPDDGVVKVRTTENWELQIDLGTGAILSSLPRRSDIIESIHDGSWFHDEAKLWIFLPSAVVVTILWITGIYLFFLPYFAKWQNRKRMRERIERRREEETHREEEDELESVTI